MRLFAPAAAALLLLVSPALAPAQTADEPGAVARWPMPGRDWVSETPDTGEPGVEAVFVHRRGDEALGAIRITRNGDRAPVEDLRAFARGRLATLVETPPAFVLMRATVARVAGRAAYAFEYRSPDGRRRYQDVFATGPGGRVVVFTLEAPANVYEQERPAFDHFLRACGGSVQALDGGTR